MTGVIVKCGKKKNLEESLMQRCDGEFVDSRAQSGEAKKGEHQNEPITNSVANSWDRPFP